VTNSPQEGEDLSQKPEIEEVPSELPRDTPSQLLKKGPFETIELDPSNSEERKKLLDELIKQYSGSSTSTGVLETAETRKKYAFLCQLWINKDVGSINLPLAECILGM
jgi:hypothetical protein